MEEYTSLTSLFDSNTPPLEIGKYLESLDSIELFSMLIENEDPKETTLKALEYLKLFNESGHNPDPSRKIVETFLQNPSLEDAKNMTSWIDMMIIEFQSELEVYVVSHERFKLDDDKVKIVGQLLTEYSIKNLNTNLENLKSIRTQLLSMQVIMLPEDEIAS